MNQKLAIVIFAFAFMVAIVAGFYSPEREAPAPAAAMREKWQDSIKKKNDSKVPLPTPVPKEATSARKPASSGGAKKLASGLDLESFTKKYGDRLTVNRDGSRVIRMSGLAIRSEELDPSQRVARFSPADAAALSARGKEIFMDARSLLGIPEGTQFLDPVITAGETTGQLVYQQAEDGVPIYPGGLVTVLIGPEGELRTLDSSVYPETEIANTPVIPAPAESHAVLFVVQSSPVAVLRHAYEVQVRGVLSVVDAASGEVLLNRSRRNY